MHGVSLSPGLWGNNLEQSCFRFSTLFRLTLRKAVFNHLFHPQEGIFVFLPSFLEVFHLWQTKCFRFSSEMLRSILCAVLR